MKDRTRVPTDTASLGFLGTVTTVKNVHQHSHCDTRTEKGAALGGEARTVQLKATLTLSTTQGQVGACVLPRPSPEVESRNVDTREASEMTIRQSHFTETEPAAPSGSR